jgi:flagellar biosynthesis protein FliR
VFDTGDMFLWMLTSFRAGGLMMVLPLFIGRAIPRTLRVAFAALLGWIVMPYAAEAVVYPAHLFELVLLIAKELSIGLLMGFAVRLVFFALDIATQILSVEIGLNPAPEFNPDGGAASGNPLGTGLFYLGLLIFVSGAHYAVFFSFARSFELVPPGIQAVDTTFVSVAIKHTARLFALGLLMAAPVMATNFLVNLAFSILGRVVPRMNVFVISFSARIVAGMSMLALSIGLIAHYIVQELNAAPELMLHFIPFAPR